MRFSILGSSSSGNCALLETENSKALIDIGFSCKRVCSMLEERSLSPDEIDAIFITHEHSDHIAGLSTFAHKFGVDVYANMMTAKALQPKLKHRPNWRFFNTGSTFSHRDLIVESFSIPHDAHDPVGFTFTSGRDDLFSPIRKLGWLTDLGFAPRGIEDRIRDADILVLEANHDEELLQNHPNRPWQLKQRIGGRHGHLSNKAARSLLDSASNARLQQVYLAHLSSDCNSLEAVDEVFSDLKKSGNYAIETVAPGAGSATIEV